MYNIYYNRMFYMETESAKKWFYDGKLHRYDAPAVEYVNGIKNGG